ncbi:cell wall-binding repeat-containing protein [Haloimpatiens sp. FM7315]|uniref:cell wall-binding repeat-containing protein n=1 Tax=Haloimpatiens sp. FM7315 TaxID=3298609 RepID=UPI00397785CF
MPILLAGKTPGLSDDNIVRLGGKDRYETSIKIAKYFHLNSDTVTFANGNSFSDALSGSALSSLKDAPLLLINNENVSKQKLYLDSTKYTKEIFYDGKGVISDTTIDKLSKN